MNISPYGDCRFTIEASKLISLSCKFYFANFYCSPSHIHYITIVITKPGSTADKLCKYLLPALDPQQNPFFTITKVSKKQRKFFVLKNSRAWVEIFYSDAVDTKIGEFANIHTLGSCRRVPYAKNKKCEICNI